MSDQPEYEPPKVWSWYKANGGAFAAINRPVAGPTHDKELPVGRHPLQLYSLATPNGVKVTVMLQELLALGHSGAEYDAWLIEGSLMIAAEALVQFGIPVEHAMAKVRSIRASRYATLKDFYKKSAEIKVDRSSK